MFYAVLSSATEAAIALTQVGSEERDVLKLGIPLPLKNNKAEKK